MVNVILCGRPGSGKSEIARELRTKYNTRFQNHACIDNIAVEVLRRNGRQMSSDFQRDNEMFKSVQQQIVEQVYRAEQDAVERRRQFITANSIIDGLVLLRSRSRNEAGDRLLASPDVQNALERYKSSLVVLLNPDDTDLQSKKDGWLEVTGEYVDLFVELAIPFIDLKEQRLDRRLSEIDKACSGQIGFATDILRLYYVSAQQTTNNRRRTENNNFRIQNNFSFFLESDEKEKRLQIPTIKLYQHEYKQEWAKFPNGQTSRFITRFGNKRLLCVHFDINFESKSAQELLLKGVKVNGKTYQFLGCSGNGIKQRKCYMWRGTRVEVDDILKECGDFDKITSVWKYLTSISLLFSNVFETPIKVNDKRIISVKDIEHNGYTFTDGCGAIGTSLAKELAAQLKDKALDSEYVPSVFQVRFQGYKGVLAVDPTIDANSILVRLSMKKFETNAFSNLCVCGFSKPYTFGHLNKQFIQLLIELGVQKAEKRNGRVPESRNMYGVCDQSETLDYGQCFLRVTVDGKPVTISGQVVVCKNPCYFIGDVRVLTAVSDSSVGKLNHLVDCIVFPAKGKRPHADEIAGSDLDGDQFFVTWDKDLVPKTVRPPYDFPSFGSRPEGEITLEKIYCHFSRQNDVEKLMKQVDKLFNMWADRKGVSSSECVQLGQLFARAVDASKTGDVFEIPEELLSVEPE